MSILAFCRSAIIVFIRQDRRHSYISPQLSAARRYDPDDAIAQFSSWRPITARRAASAIPVLIRHVGLLLGLVALFSRVDPGREDQPARCARWL